MSPTKPAQRPSRAARQRVIEAVRLAPMRRRHLDEVMRIEREAYVRPWTTNLFLSELAQRGTRRYRVALVGPKVVGYAGLMMVGDEGHVNTLTVDPRWHRHGIGTLLLADLAHGAIGLGARHLTLEVRASNIGAQALYRRFGFAPVGVRRNYYSETGEDAIVMWAEHIDSDEYRRRLERIMRELRQ
jgi:ribosomal-protein-alanine N-acetyltransferase